MTANMNWDRLDWLASARSIVEWVNKRPSEERIMIFIRHSHREVIQDHSTQFSTGLTDIGRQMSYEMGRRLQTGSPLKVFYSFIPRSSQTAEELVKGFRDNGGEVVEYESIAILVMPEFDDEAVWENLQPDGKNVTEFVNRWADGEFGDLIESFDSYRSRLLDETLRRLLKESGPALHIHVTHDLALMALKRILLRRPIGNEDRESFQGGICNWIDGNGSWHLYNSGEESNIYPLDQ